MSGTQVTQVPGNTQEIEPAVAAEVEYLTPPAQSRRKTWLVRLVSIVVVLCAWEFFGRHVNPLFMSYPSAIVRAGITLAASGELTTALASSLRTLLSGYVIASAIGISLGLVIGRYQLADAATDWLVNALYATPLIATIPLVILWFGLGDEAKLFIVTLTAVFRVLINTASGVRNVPQALIEVGAAFAANEWQVFAKIIFPAVLPYIMTGLRLGIGRAIIGMVAAEFFTSITGLGALIVKYGNQYDTAAMFVPILILMLLGVGLTALVRHIEAVLAPWRANED